MLPITRTTAMQLAKHFVTEPWRKSGRSVSDSLNHDGAALCFDSRYCTSILSLDCSEYICGGASKCAEIYSQFTTNSVPKYWQQRSSAYMREIFEDRKAVTRTLVAHRHTFAQTGNESLHCLHVMLRTVGVVASSTNQPATHMASLLTRPPLLAFSLSTISV